MSRNPSFVTLLTDFGTTDYFVGAMKGVIFGINPSAQIVDITHDIPPQDIEAAAFILLNSYPSFPDNSVHVAVVDPGVGSNRRPIVVRAANQFFVGPDNGVFSYVCEREATHQTIHVTADQYFKHPVSTTFHGRDVFAPVAAAITKGLPLTDLGRRITDSVRLASLSPTKLDNGKIEGRIIHVDRFGNCVTNISRKDLSVKNEAAAVIRVKGKTIRSFRRFFADDAQSRDKFFSVWGSAGFLEIAVANNSAARLLKAERGTQIVLDIKRA